MVVSYEVFSFFSFSVCLCIRTYKACVLFPSNYDSRIGQIQEGGYVLVCSTEFQLSGSLSRKFSYSMLLKKKKLCEFYMNSS